MSRNKPLPRIKAVLRAGDWAPTNLCLRVSQGRHFVLASQLHPLLYPSLWLWAVCMNFVSGVPRVYHLQAATATLGVGSASPRKVADLLNVFVASAVGRGRLQHKGLAAHGQYLRVCISHSGSLCLSGVSVEVVDTPDGSYSPEQETETDVASPDAPEEQDFLPVQASDERCEAVRKGRRRVFRRMLADLESQRPDGRRTPGPPGPASCNVAAAPASGGAARRWQGPRLGPPHRLGGTWHRLARFFGGLASAATANPHT